MIPLLFLLISGVCAPYNQSDCDFTVIIYDSDRAWGYAEWGEAKTLHFGGDYYNTRDCWGMRYYEHEWLHMAIGNFHHNGLPCLLRGHGMY